MSTPAKAPRSLPIVEFRDQAGWEEWLERNHGTSAGVWLRLEKKGSGVASPSYDEALETALCFGWIDGQKDRFDDTAWLQKLTPRGPKSIWSKVNREKAEKLIANGRMRPAGLQAVERAKHGGQWEAAYDSQSRSTVPPDLQAELDKSQAAREFFATLNSQNRYAILFRIQTAKKAETRARRIRDFTAMLERKEKLYP
jgi:uncharacterized protein YdeI (YjbR/CyaY-like superfamily)